MVVHSSCIHAHREGCTHICDENMRSCEDPRLIITQRNHTQILVQRQLSRRKSVSSVDRGPRLALEPRGPRKRVHAHAHRPAPLFRPSSGRASHSARTKMSPGLAPNHPPRVSRPGSNGPSRLTPSPRPRLAVGTNGESARRIGPLLTCSGTSGPGGRGAQGAVTRVVRLCYFRSPPVPREQFPRRKCGREGTSKPPAARENRAGRPGAAAVEEEGEGIDGATEARDQERRRWRARRRERARGSRRGRR